MFGVNLLDIHWYFVISQELSNDPFTSYAAVFLSHAEILRLESEQTSFLLLSYLSIGCYDCLRILLYLENERETSFIYWYLFLRIVSTWSH